MLPEPAPRARVRSILPKWKTVIDQAVSPAAFQRTQQRSGAASVRRLCRGSGATGRGRQTERRSGNRSRDTDPRGATVRREFWSFHSSNRGDFCGRNYRSERDRRGRNGGAALRRNGALSFRHCWRIYALRSRHRWRIHRVTHLRPVLAYTPQAVGKPPPVNGS